MCPLNGQRREQVASIVYGLAKWTSQPKAISTKQFQLHNVKYRLTILNKSINTFIIFFISFYNNTIKKFVYTYQDIYKTSFSGVNIDKNTLIEKSVNSYVVSKFIFVFMMHS